MMIAVILASASTGMAKAQTAAPPSSSSSSPSSPPPPASYTPDSIFMALFANGDALVEYDIMLANSTTIAAAESGKVKVRLFGTNISELIVTDLDDKILPFNVTSPGVIELIPGKATGARISYLTPDLVNKIGRIWTFTLEAPMEVAVKMPADSISVDYGNNVPALSQIGTQTLLTFKAGSIRFSYIVGTLGTEDQADLTIKFASAAIQQAKASNQGIVLSDEEAMLANATAAKTAGRFGDAIKTATQISDQVQRTITDYTAAQSEISRASAQISQASSEGRDTARAASFLEQARGEFSQGKYPQARSTIAQAVAAISDAPAAQVPPTFLFALTGIVVAGGGAGAYMFFFRKRSGNKQQSAATTTTVPRDETTDLFPRSSSSSSPLAADPLQPAALDPQQQDQLQVGEQQEEQHPPEVANNSNNPTPFTGALPAAESARALAGIPESQTDATRLAGIVSKIIEEKPHLRPEDRDVLAFLAEKEGAVFESEVRTKFNLPKTTVWRLVKRLEREELVEIRKAGGQNLIKLRFEGRQA
ncbi:MAG TPA: hypothetical protein VHA09_03785 [Nitrososphaera sp.]|nr:hypothetical protein [Nitrososphaera sp.]